MLKRICALLLALLLAAPSVGADYWPESHVLQCGEKSVNCQILQLVMMGRFGEMDPNDLLDTRVYAAVLPHLLAMAEEDMTHFIEEFQVEKADVERCLYAAIGHCLWADILISPEQEDERLTASRRVLLLFLGQSSAPKDVEARAIIRSQLTDEIISDIAQLNGLETAFLEYLFYSDDWQDVTIDQQ